MLSDKHEEGAIFVEPKALRLLEVGAVLVNYSVVFGATLLSVCRRSGPLLKRGGTSKPPLYAIYRYSYY